MAPRTPSRSLRAAVLVTLLFGPPAACRGPEISEDELAALAAEAHTTASRVRGLSAGPGAFKEAIASREEVERYIGERFRATDAATLYRSTGRILEDLGALGAGVDLAEAVQRAVTREVAGFYDWERKTLFIADWIPRMLQLPILVHEVTHALQDAHFGLGRFMTPKAGADDAQAAAQALIEGDATLVMVLALLPDPEDAPGVDAAIAMVVSSAEQQVAQIDAPPVVAEALVFPYNAGLTLARAVQRARGWAGLDRLYADPPLSTEQVLHPEKYLDTPRDQPQRVVAPVPAALAAGGWREAHRAVLGEFGVRMVLRIGGGDLSAAKVGAAGWDGDEALLLERAAGGESLTLVTSVWDDEAEAKEAEEALRRMARPPVAMARAGLRVAGLWGAAEPRAQEAVEEALRTASAREARHFEDFVTPVR